jgi:hypothetical protein
VPAGSGAAQETADSADETKSLSLPWTSMLGTILIAGTLQLLALLLWLIEAGSRKSLSELCGLANEPSLDDHETSQEVSPKQQQEQRASFDAVHASIVVQTQPSFSTIQSHGETVRSDQNEASNVLHALYLRSPS